MRSTSQDALICPQKKTGYSWDYFPTVMMLSGKQRSIILNQMVAITAHMNVIQPEKGQFLPISFSFIAFLTNYQINKMKIN